MLNTSKNGILDVIFVSDSLRITIYLNKGNFFGLCLNRKTKASFRGYVCSLSVKYSFALSNPMISKL